LAIRLEVLIQSVHMYDDPDAAKSAMPQLIGRDAEVTIFGIIRHSPDEPVSKPQLRPFRLFRQG
ncbi:MAG: hypothetical protein NUW01_12040, partial [Gemmatimonadaceae bacterium]|nr:hypothetical protein [Gemmatimonadaceae bacterium]